MPVNKNALGRFIVIDQCLSTHRRYLWSDLANACEFSLQVRQRPSKSTLLHDISFMRQNMSAPIVCTRDGFYYYSEPYSIFHAVMDETVKNDMLRALQVLEELPDLSIHTPLIQHIGHAGSKEKTKLLDLEKNTQLKGLWFLPLIFKLLEAGKMARISYQPYGKNKIDSQIHPLLIKEYRNRWFLFAADSIDEEIQCFAIDRIESIAMLNETADKSKLSHLLQMLGHIVGVSSPKQGKIERIVFTASYPTCEYIVSKPIHSSQKLLHENEDGKKFGLELIVNYELIQQLLGFGAALHIIEPLSLSNEMASIALEMHKSYTKNHS